jgi:hypothetical protein
MNAIILDFPKSRTTARRPNTVQIQFDFGQWALAYYQDHRFVSRLGFPSKAAAEAEATRLAEGGMTWRMGNNGIVFVMPDSTGAGCWAVAHRLLPDGGDAVLGHHLSIDDAIPHAIRAAREAGAELILNGPCDDNGGAA